MSEKLQGIFISDDESLPMALGLLFAQMSSYDQAEFFNEVARQTEDWDKAPEFQWRYMQDELTVLGKETIDAMSDHTSP